MLQPASDGAVRPLPASLHYLSTSLFSSPELLTIPPIPQAVLFLPVLPAPCPLPGVPFFESRSGQHFLILWRWLLPPPRNLHPNCPHRCLSSCPHWTASPMTAFDKHSVVSDVSCPAFSCPWDSESTALVIGSRSQLWNLERTTSSLCSPCHSHEAPRRCTQVLASERVTWGTVRGSAAPLLGDGGEGKEVKKPSFPNGLGLRLPIRSLTTAT